MESRADLRAEIDRLREENKRLKDAAAGKFPPKEAKKGKPVQTRPAVSTTDMQTR